MSDKCYSADGEYYHNDLQSAIEDIRVGDVIYVGNTTTPCPSEFVPDANWIIEYMGENAYENLGECAEDWPDVNKEAKQELDAFLKDWAVRNCKVDFYRVEYLRDYVVTTEDLA